NITTISPASAPIGASVTITGTGFGTAPGIVAFNSTQSFPITSWNPTSIVVPVPSGATSGNVIVYVAGTPSNGVPFNVTPNITSLSPASGSPGTSVTITGTGFGFTQGTSTVTFNGVAASPTSWNSTTIVAQAPAGATTGNVVVTVGGVASN